MKLVHFALSACLVVGSMATLTVPAFADGGYSRHGGHSGGYRSGHGHGRGHIGGHRRSHRGHGGHGGHRSRGNGGAFIAGTVVGALLGWSGGYGYPRAHHGRYGRHHQPYYAPRGYQYPRHYNRHTRNYYSYSDGGYHGAHSYQARGNAGCHPVHKFGHWHGRPAKVGGTMCYNRNGGGYVVNGSRYLIHYR
jgi:hypothetical protein